MVMLEVIGWALFSLCAIVHAATFVINPMAQWPGVMWLHLAVLGYCFTGAFASGGFKRPDQQAGQPATTNPPTKPRPNQLDFRHVPAWMRYLMRGLFVYTLVNFALFMYLSELGGPGIKNGQKVLQSHGRTIRPLTDAEYERQQAYVVRGFSGHWLLFTWLPVMMLVERRKRELAKLG